MKKRTRKRAFSILTLLFLVVQIVLTPVAQYVNAESVTLEISFDNPTAQEGDILIATLTDSGGDSATLTFSVPTGLSIKEFTEGQDNIDISNKDAQSLSFTWKEESDQVVKVQVSADAAGDYMPQLTSQNEGTQSVAIQVTVQEPEVTPEETTEEATEEEEVVSEEEEAVSEEEEAVSEEEEAVSEESKENEDADLVDTEDATQTTENEKDSTKDEKESDNSILPSNDVSKDKKESTQQATLQDVNSRIDTYGLVEDHDEDFFAVGDKITTDKTAEWVDKDDPTYADVTLKVPGDTEAMGTDIVFVMGNGPAASPKVLGYLKITIREILKEFGDTGATVKLGLVCFSEKNEIVLDLTEMREEDMDTVIETALNAYESAYSGINMESALLTAKAMLDADTSVPAERKHMILISTGLTYFFDNDQGQSSTIVGTDNRDVPADDGNGSEDRYVWSNKYWLMARNGTTSTGNGYVIPFGWSWDKYWENIVTWVKNDGDAYVYTPMSYLDFVSTADGYDNNKEYQPIINGNVNKNYRYGYVITDPADKAAAAEVAVPYFKGGSNPDTTPNAAHALNCERAWYESWEVFTAMEKAGYNCYSIANGPALWLKENQAGRNFMNMLAGGTAPVYSETENFFAPIHESILYSVGSGSYVEDYMGYDADEGYDFDFVTDPKTITLTVGGTTYTTTALENAKDGCDYSYIFTAPGTETAAFTLDYVYGNGKTDEKFTWYFGESVSEYTPVSLSYQVMLRNKQTAASEYTVYTNKSATLYPVDGEAVDFPKPELKYDTKDESIKVTKTVEGEESIVATAGQEVEYKIVVENTGNTAINGLELTDEFDLGELELYYEVDGKQVLYTEGTKFNLGHKGIQEFTANYKIPTDIKAGTYQNLAVVSNGSVSGEDEADVVIEAKPSLKVSKTTDKSQYKQGETVHYTIKVTNDGNVDLKGITLEGIFSKNGDDSIEQLQLEGYTGPINLRVGERATFTATFVIPETDPADTVYKNVIIATVDDVDMEPVSDEETIIVDPTYALEVNKQADKEEAKVGETITYTITVTNTGKHALTNVNVVDEMVGLDTVIEKIEVGENETFTVEHVATAEDVGELTNIAVAKVVVNGKEIVDEGSVTVKVSDKDAPVVTPDQDNSATVDQEKPTVIDTVVQGVNKFIENPKTGQTTLNILLVLAIFLIAGSGLYVWKRKH